MRERVGLLWKRAGLGELRSPWGVLLGMIAALPLGILVGGLVGLSLGLWIAMPGFWVRAVGGLLPIVAVCLAAGAYVGNWLGWAILAVTRAAARPLGLESFASHEVGILVGGCIGAISLHSVASVVAVGKAGPFIGALGVRIAGSGGALVGLWAGAAIAYLVVLTAGFLTGAFLGGLLEVLLRSAIRGKRPHAPVS